MNDEIQFKIPQGRYQVNGVDVGMIENVECVVVQKQYLDELKRKYAWLIRHAWICAAISKAKAAELLGCSLIDFDEKYRKLMRSWKMDKYQKIKDLGLEVISASVFHKDSLVVSADRFSEALEAAVEVYTHSDSKKPSYWGPKENGQFNDTHTGLVVGIKPLKAKEVTITREDLKTAFSDGLGIVDISYFDVIARRLGL